MIISKASLVLKKGTNANTIDISVSLHNIGCEYRHLKNYHEAGKFLRDALTMRRFLYPAGIHPEVARTHWLLGLNYHDLDNHDKAQHHLYQAYDIITKCEGYDVLLTSIQECLSCIVNGNKLELSHTTLDSLLSHTDLPQF